MADNLRRVVNGADDWLRATYNGDNLRVTKHDFWSPVDHTYSWGLGGILHDSRNDTLNTPGVSQRVNGSDQFVHSDWLGSTRDLTDITGNTLLAWQHYDAFGQRTWQAGPDFPSEFLFAGDWGYQNEYNSPTEPGVGLQYLQNRYYDPAVGRFISPDPSWFDGGANRYDYVDNDPANAVDPAGLNPLAPVAVAGAHALQAGGAAVSAGAHAAGHAVVVAGSAAVGAFVGSAHATARVFLALGQRLGLAPKGVSCAPARPAPEVRYRQARPGRPLSEEQRLLRALMNPEQRAYAVAKQYGINLRGSGKTIILRFDPTLGTGRFGLSRIVEPGVIYFGLDALQSDKELAKTLAHELRHQRDYLSGKPTSPEGPAYASQRRIEEYIEGRR